MVSAMTSSKHGSWRRLVAAGGVALAMLVSLATAAWAASLDEAKAAGLVGERPDGFVAAVQPNPPPDIAALVQQVNSGRRAAYADIAAKEGVPVEQVGALAAEKIRAQAAPGAYFMTPGGSWTQK
jgi:uncharacterized protein YdbL (DUF1318 family)